MARPYRMTKPRAKRGARPLPVAFAEGRRHARANYGEISGRVYVGLTKEDLAFLKWFATDGKESLGSTVRSVIAEKREEMERNVLEDIGMGPPWTIKESERDGE